MSQDELHNRLSGKMSETEIKSVMKEAITEWMDAKFQAFGKWTITGLAVAAIGALTYFILRMNGWELIKK